MKGFKKLTALALAAVLVAGLLPVHAAPEVLTRQQTAELLVAAADDYNPGVRVEDVMKGYGDGLLHENEPVTRIQALVMLRAAFGEIPTPVGQTARQGSPNRSFSDVPAWAEELASDLFAAGLVVGEEDGSLRASAPVTRKELDTLIRRMYVQEGTNLKDDYYFTVNREYLDTAAIPAGQLFGGAWVEAGVRVNRQVEELIRELAAEEQVPGTAEAVISAFYRTATDWESRDSQGVEPLRPYLEAIDGADSLGELIEVRNRITRELGNSIMFDFEPTVDSVDSSRIILSLVTSEPVLDQDSYASGSGEAVEVYRNYLINLMTTSGMEQAAAEADADRVIELERSIAAADLSPEEKYDAKKTSNYLTWEELQALFPHVELDSVLRAYGLYPEDRIWVPYLGAAKALAAVCDETHLQELKAMLRARLLNNNALILSHELADHRLAFEFDVYGMEKIESAEDRVIEEVMYYLGDYIDRAYAEKFFSPEAKADVESMVQDILAVYRSRVSELDWMSEESKAGALRKLDNLGTKVGYPDSWETFPDNVDIRAPGEGGTFFSNVAAIQLARLADAAAMQGTEADRSWWNGSVCSVSAWYTDSNNDITLPAAFLQPPFYDVNASREENLVGIGETIAHEITHAIDNFGCCWDEYGNAVATEENPYGWWTEEDYLAFVDRCEEVVAWYDGWEAAPGLPCNGRMTLSENVADLGALRCIMDCAAEEEDIDYDVLFRSYAQLWAVPISREAIRYYTAADVHANENLRVNRVLQSLDEFYETYEIREGDGMWTEPSTRPSVW